MNGILWSVFFFFFFGVKFGIFFIDQRELKVGTGNVDFQYFDFEGKLRVSGRNLGFSFYRRMERLF